MQDQTRKAFGYYARRQAARAMGSPSGELNLLLRKQVDDLESLRYVVPPAERLKSLLMKQADDLDSSVTPDSLAMDHDGDSLPDEKSYSRLAERSPGYEVGNNDYVTPSKVEDISFMDALVGQDKDNLHIDVSGHGSPDIIIARPDVAKELGSTFVNGFGDVAKVVSSDDIGYDYDGDSLPDEKSYRRLARRARGYEAGSLTDDYVQPSKADDYVQPPNVDEYVASPKDISFTDALVRQDDNKVHVDDSMRSFMNADDKIFVTPEADKEMGSVFVDDFGNRGKVVTKDQVGKQARDYEAGNLTDDYVAPPKADGYVQPPKYDDCIQPPTAPDMEAFDASQFEMSNNEATKTIDDEPMSTIDEGQFDMAPTKGLQQ